MMPNFFRDVNPELTNFARIERPDHAHTSPTTTQKKKAFATTFFQKFILFHILFIVVMWQTPYGFSVNRLGITFTLRQL